MAVSEVLKKRIGMIALLGTLYMPNIAGQEPRTGQPSLSLDSSAKLVDEFGILGSEDRSARFDFLFQEIAKNTNSVGYVLLYCGKKCRYGEIEAHIRGIEVKIGLRRFDRSRLVILNAGFRDVFLTEFWLAPEGSCPPIPRSTLNIKNVIFARTSTRILEAYECCDDNFEHWKTLKP